MYTFVHLKKYVGFIATFQSEHYHCSELTISKVLEEGTPLQEHYFLT